MTRAEIIKLAREAGLPEAWISETGVLKWSELERFAALVAEREREACLQIADQCADADMHASMVANAIRARNVT
jgi:hypothetical protein